MGFWTFHGRFDLVGVETMPLKCTCSACMAADAVKCPNAPGPLGSRADGNGAPAPLSPLVGSATLHDGCTVWCSLCLTGSGGRCRFYSAPTPSGGPFGHPRACRPGARLDPTLLEEVVIARVTQLGQKLVWADPTRTADQRSRAPAPRTGQFQTEDWSSGILTLWSYYNFSPAVIGRGSAGSTWTTHTGCTSPSLTGLVSSARGRSGRWLRSPEVWLHRVGACWTLWWSSLRVVLPFCWLPPLRSCASLLARTHTSLASELSVFVLRVLLIPRIRSGIPPLDEGRLLRL